MLNTTYYQSINTTTPFLKLESEDFFKAKSGPSKNQYLNTETKLQLIRRWKASPYIEIEGFTLYFTGRRYLILC